MRKALLVVVLLGALLTATPALADDATSTPDYAPPVDGPVIDHFRPPPEKWAAGNRGIDYETVPGSPVKAAEEGVVEFAGQVGGTLHVVVRHPDGLRTSYSFLASIVVVEGQQVARGTVVGTAAASLHFGVRASDTYIDPELVLRGEAFSVHLVAAEGQTEAQRRLGEMVHDAIFDGDGGFAVPGLDIAGSVASWLRSAADPSEIMRLAIHYTAATSVPSHVAGVAVATWDWYRSRSHCTSGDDVARLLRQRARDHLVILVAGFGSSSGSGAGIDGVDLAAAGVPAERVMRFSYRGGKTPASTGAPFATIDTTTYTSLDSQAALEPAAERLSDTIAAVAAANPGSPIDVIGHSQGGVVALRGLQIAAQQGALPAGTHLVTIASPHAGDTIATGADLLSVDPLHELALDEAERSLDQFADDVHDDGSARDLSSASPFMAT
ncbi:MAG TPA: peptidoglycan DD-metalloendopeptidase family protein, partial [Acidimicrobiales bacterium]|nr:peptidoglycan DD-metalloendopeptidase family protein [Acidimicrobiales bacterium]